MTYELDFGIPAPEHLGLRCAGANYPYDERPLPRSEVQLRIFLLDTSAEQHDAYPPGCFVTLDGENVPLPVGSSEREWMRGPCQTKQSILKEDRKFRGDFSTQSFCTELLYFLGLPSWGVEDF